MSDSGDYLPDMPQFVMTDADVEILLSEGKSPDPRLDDLATTLNSLALARLEVDLDSHAGRFSLRAAALARAADTAPPARMWARITPRLSAAVVAATVLVGTSGLALAADASAPGDLRWPG